MASNVALRRFKKANRRKAVVAQKRRAEATEATLSSQIRRAIAGPIHHCLVSENLLEAGSGMAVVMRGHPGEIVMVSFMLDAFCLGIKDAHARPVTGEEMDFFVDRFDEVTPMIAVEPPYARKLLRDLAAWARTIGFAPHRDFAVAERILGDVDADACDTVFRFGQDGKPHYIPGPHETQSQVRHRLETLRQSVGRDGFAVTAAAPGTTWDVRVEPEPASVDVSSPLEAPAPSPSP